MNRAYNFKYKMNESKDRWLQAMDYGAWSNMTYWQIVEDMHEDFVQLQEADNPLTTFKTDEQKTQEAE